MKTYKYKKVELIIEPIESIKCSGCYFYRKPFSFCLRDNLISLGLPDCVDPQIIFKLKP
jgi:hypothetical protein